MIPPTAGSTIGDIRDKSLKRPVCFEEEADRLSRLPLRKAGRTASDFRLWYSEHFQVGDELWWYDTGGWENRVGENGYAIVRNGVIAYIHPQMSC